jgi:hypothetical protein
LLSLALIFAAAIALDTNTPCPSEAAVRASLAGLGVGTRDRDGSASWTLAGDHLALTVLTASTATTAKPTIERVFPLGPCAELADQVALAIERATSPLGFLAIPIERPNTAIGVHAGGFVLLGGPSAVGFALGADVWPFGASFGGLAILQGTVPETFSAGVSSVKLSRYTFGGGLAMRHRFTDAFDAGISTLVIAEHIRGDPGGVLAPTTIRDWRAGVRGGGFLRFVIFGPLALSVEAHLRAGSERRYRAIPATELVVLSPFELELGLNAGAIFF